MFWKTPNAKFFVIKANKFTKTDLLQDLLQVFQKSSNWLLNAELFTYFL